MKRILIGMVLSASSLCATAQSQQLPAGKPLPVAEKKDNVFADLGVSFTTGLPGASVTYSRKVTKRFGIGLGAQGYFYDRVDAGQQVNNKFIPAVYGDFRWYWHVKYGQLFLLADVGIDIYKGYDADHYGYTAEHSDGLYTGIGFGYAGKLKNSCISPYLSVKIVSDTYTSYDNYMDHTYTILSTDATIVFSAGIRF